MAYNRYQYETSPRKIEPDYGVRTKQNKKVSKKVNENKNVKQKLNAKVKMVLYVFIGFAILFTIGYRNSQITETFNKKESLKKELSLAQKENEQLKISIENTLNLNTVEQLAKEKLGMQKLNNNQKIYVNLDKKDYIETAAEEVMIEDNTSVWNKILETITNLFKN